MERASFTLAAALAAWKRIVGDDAVLHGPALLAARPACTTGAQRDVPAIIRLTRESADEHDDHYITSRLIPILRVAEEFDIPVHPISTGRNWGYGTWLPPGGNCVVLDLGAINRIRHFDAELGSVMVEPGVTQQQLARFLSTHGHPYLVPVTGAGPHCSLLGNALERGYGITPTADHFAAALAIEAVLADGSRYRSPMDEFCPPASSPAFKWGVGSYLDGLFTQSGMGVVTAMKLALARRPESVSVFVAQIPASISIGAIASAVHQIKCTLPGLVGGINLLNARRALAMTAPFPWDTLGSDGMIPAPALSALQTQYGITEWTLFGTLYGTRRTAAAAKGDIRRCLAACGVRPRFHTTAQLRFFESISARVPLPRIRHSVNKHIRMLRMAAELVEGYPNETALPLAYWRNRATAGEQDALDPARDGCGLIWYAPLVPMKPGNVTRFVDFVTATMSRHAMEPLITLTTVNENCFDSSVPLLFDAAAPDGASKAMACYEELFHAGIEQGFVPYRLPVDAMPQLANYNLSHHALALRLKQAIDPKDIISPGRYCNRYFAASNP